MHAWLVDRRFDTAFYLASVVAVVLAYLVFEVLCLWVDRDSAALWLYLVFAAVFDGPHVFQSFARTHLDATERKRRPLIHLVLPPMLLITGWALTVHGHMRELILGLGALGSFHIMRQNVGLLRAYGVVSSARRQAQWATRAFFVVWLVSLVAMYSRYELVPLPPSWTHGVAGLTTVLGLAFMVTWMVLIRSVDEPSSVPGLVFFLMVTAATSFAHLLANVPMLALIVFATIYHDIQYLGWMHTFQRKRLKLSKRWIWGFAALSLLYGMLYASSEYLSVAQGTLFSGLVATSFAMITAYHYIADGFIWRFRSQPELREMFSA
ncbi:MAG: hypothetical protein AAFQ82_12470 [Myxococcota bacterium]